MVKKLEELEMIVKLKNGRKIKLHYKRPKDEIPHAWPPFIIVEGKIRLEEDRLEMDETTLRLTNCGIEEVTVALEDIVDIQILKLK
jgi:uncharacterized protein YhdP